MGDDNKKSEIQGDFGEDLLELANSDEGKENELSKLNTCLTLPAFEDQDDQDSWDDFAKAPVKTKMSPFLKEAIGDSKRLPIEAEQQKAVPQKIKNSNEIKISPERKDNPGPPKAPPFKNHHSKEKVPISNVETIAITILQKAIVENNVQQAPLPQVPQKNLMDGAPNQNYKGGGQIPSTPVVKLEPPPNLYSESNENNNRTSELKLGHVEQIRIAQNRISQLDKEVETLRWDNEKLGAAAQLLQKKCEELNNQKQKLEGRFDNFETKATEENKILKLKIENKREENKELRLKIEDLESRLGQDVRRSGGRERDLENRLELIKMEKISLVASKDEIILNLKRQIDHLQFEVESYRKKTSELQKTIDANEEQIRRTVRALRLALTNLEVSEESKMSKKSE